MLIADDKYVSLTRREYELRTSLVSNASRKHVTVTVGKWNAQFERANDVWRNTSP